MSGAALRAKKEKERQLSGDCLHLEMSLLRAAEPLTAIPICKKTCGAVLQPLGDLSKFSHL
jgi:hypothetical protein